MKRLTSQARALLDKYRVEIMRTRVDFYDDNQALRTGVVTDVYWSKGDIELKVLCLSTHRVRFDDVRIAK